MVRLGQVALAVVALLAIAAAAAAQPCRPIPGLDPLIRPGAVLLLGEIHGTAEAPAFAGDVACHVTRAGFGVVVGLELPVEGQGRVDEFLASAGGDEDRRSLVAGPSWRRSYQDGRNSLAMLELIERVGRLRRAGLPARVALFDTGTSRGGAARERGMAARLAEVAAEDSRAVMVVLTGNLHSGKARGLPGNADAEPMGHLLARAISPGRIVSLAQAHGGGTAWICSAGCGVVQLRGRRGELRWEIELGDGAAAGHDGWYHVGELTASPPAGLDASEIDWGARSPAAPSVPEATPPGRGSPAPVPGRPLSPAEARVQGRWQGYDHRQGHRTWTLEVEGRRFRAAGSGQWYEGRLVVGGDRQPASIDFVIERCRCAHEGATSKAIFEWRAGAWIVGATPPGNPRPRWLDGSEVLLRFEPATPPAPAAPPGGSRAQPPDPPPGRR